MYQLRTSQKVPASKKKVWEFISSPKNLAKITPAYMSFKIHEPVPETIYPGLMIHYTVKPVLGIPLQWVTEITHVKEEDYFVDEQRIGPYKMWHHEHHLKETPNGILMEDIVSYTPPFKWLGQLANGLFIEKQLASIFNYRKNAIEKEFGIHT